MGRASANGAINLVLTTPILSAYQQAKQNALFIIVIFFVGKLFLLNKTWYNLSAGISISVDYFYHAESQHELQLIL